MCETMKSIMQDDRKSGAFRKIRNGAQMATRKERGDEFLGRPDQ